MGLCQQGQEDEVGVQRHIEPDGSDAGRVGRTEAIRLRISEGEHQAANQPPSGDLRRLWSIYDLQLEGAAEALLVSTIRRLSCKADLTDKDL